MRIGDAAAAAGATPRALRFHEEHGLLPPPPRTATGQRRYGPGEVARVRVVRELLALGLTVEDLRGIADSAPVPGRRSAAALRARRNGLPRPRGGRAPAVGPRRRDRPPEPAARPPGATDGAGPGAHRCAAPRRPASAPSGRGRPRQVRMRAPSRPVARRRARLAPAHGFRLTRRRSDRSAALPFPRRSQGHLTAGGRGNRILPPQTSGGSPPCRTTAASVAASRRWSRSPSRPIPSSASSTRGTRRTWSRGRVTWRSATVRRTSSAAGSR
ncbi:MerR family transcriptional regulator [Streptomyces viridosporus]|uniref:helix-turn-helix domain-containing protein n=1 Tax=Streptomyces viridosporus TaxID=67581 RepID=UPI0036F6B43E